MNILIADDEPLIHVSIQYTIQALNRPDVTVFNAANGREMLAEMQRAPVDLALVDIRMPGMSGLEAIQQAKAHWPDTDYYIMSGYSEFEYARQAVHLGVAEYLLKPLPPCPDCFFVVVMPSVGISTPEAFQRYDRMGSPLHPDCDRQEAAIRAGDLPGLCAAAGNALEHCSGATETPAIRALLDEHGALTSLMTGSGAAVFGVFDAEDKAQAAAEALRARYKQVYLARPDRGGARVSQ